MINNHDNSNNKHGSQLSFPKVCGVEMERIKQHINTVSPGEDKSLCFCIVHTLLERKQRKHSQLVHGNKSSWNYKNKSIFAVSVIMYLFVSNIWIVTIALSSVQMPVTSHFQMFYKRRNKILYICIYIYTFP